MKCEFWVPHDGMQEEADTNVKFPILVNSNEAILKSKVNDKELRIDVIGLDGKKTDELIIKK